jgi:Rad3-related DNA helicase
MTAKTREVESPKLIPAIKKIMEDYPNDKGLIHTVSYKLAGFITSSINSRRFVSHINGADRFAALESFKGSNEPLILLSPSMERGIDLPFDLCRFIIIAKVMYPDLGDKQISKRLYSGPFGQMWYKWMTTCSIVQASMRGMRSKDDQCDVWILDKQFGEFYPKTRELFPEWYREAIKLVES